MTVKPIKFACVVVLAVAAASVACGQEPRKSKDAELESLLEDLKDRDPGTNSSAKKAAKPVAPAETKSRAGESGTTKKKANAAGSKQDTAKSGAASGQKTKPAPKTLGSGSLAPGSKQDTAKSGAASGQKTKPAPKTLGSGSLAPKDQAIDDLLGKLGETKDEPSREERSRNQDTEASPPQGERKPGAGQGAKLEGKDKEIDDRLEELAGRKRKRAQADNGERSGPIGEMIKEMRDVEQRLGKPDPSEDTQAKQKQIIKRIDTLIEQVRQSGSSAGRLTMRRRQQQGNQPGQQQGDQTGAMAQGAGPMKAAKPTSQHSTAGGKGIWGHLPEELRQVMDNISKEDALGSKAEMISRYFTSVGKLKLIREE